MTIVGIGLTLTPIAAALLLTPLTLLLGWMLLQLWRERG